MATYPLQVAPHGGVDVDYSVTPATTGNTAPAASGNGLLVRNGSGASINVVLHVAETVDGLTVTPRTVAVAAGKDRVIPLPDLYADPATGLITFDVSAVASVTCAVLRVAT